ncbi:hypothetical protein DXG01_006025 [Tephrocybe rancida]|nr:hypothetical protein DXG01_006025 [Tephrocybe rancida]
MSARPSPGPSARLKQPQPTIGIAAGAEDAKYQTKYRELKRKVKEIETDNDKLHFKVLQAKRSIQRMKLERAILYERLAGPPSPNEPQNRHGGPMPMHPPSGGPVPPPFSRSHSGNHHYQDMGDNIHDSPNHEFSIPHERARMVSGSAMPPAGPGVAIAPRMHSPPRRASGGPGHESRHMQHLPPPSLHGPHGNSRPHISPVMHHSHSGTSHERTRSHSSSRTRAHQQSYIPGHPNQYPEGPQSVQHVMHSPPIQERERPRRHDSHEGPHPDQHQHSRLNSFLPRLSPPPDTRRVHGHPRMSPGPPGREEYDRQHERRERELDHDRNHPRDLGRNRDANSLISPPLGHRSRQPFDRGGGDYPEPHGSSRMRDEPAYYDAPTAASGYPPHSRSGSPISGSGSGNGAGGGDASRSDSRHYYEAHEHTRTYKLRPVNPPNEEMDFVHEDGRSRDRGGFEASRKRARNDMEGEDDADYQSGRAAEDRGKRYHREHRRSIDNQDEARMGAP